MKVWSGLLRKEWLSIRTGILIAAGFVFLMFLFLPMGIARILPEDVYTVEITLVLIFLWSLLAALFPVIILFILLQMDMKRPDIWLHSTASIFQLIGTKAFLAACIGLVSMLLSLVMMIGQNMIEIQATLFVDHPRIIMFIIVVMFYLSINITCTGLFFWVFNRLIKPFVKGFSIPLTMVTFFFTMYLFGKFSETKFYEYVIRTGRINPNKLLNINYQVENMSFGVNEVDFYTGEIILDIIIGVSLFIAAIILFDKKVRL